MNNFNIYEDGKIRAVLGPTNTGKTWLAIDRMLSFSSGIVGFPLRLLARENYDRALKVKNIREVALITGEEKIIPPQAKYFFCTTESMPMDRDVDFVAIDEIQLCADSERGHIFTDRLLHARGRFETMFMGAEIITPFIRMLVPKAEIETRERLSTLRWAGKKPIDRLPARSAIVSFSTNDVYALAELIRRQKGGAAVVLGALSPRTRNAQVEMYQAGEVDWLVATDAIGMGLNMDINHLAFAATKKFDGHNFRPLNAQELAQIAGRAGRGGNDGTFGTTGGIAALDDEMIDAIEAHEFQSPKHIYWRNTDLNFASVEALVYSLKKMPPKKNMQRPRYAEDEAVLGILAQDSDIKIRLNGLSNIKTLWDIARIPDFSKTHAGAHANMLKPILIDILDKGVIRAQWMEKQFTRLNKETNDLEKLLQHIAAVRTLTYISYQKQWLNNAESWQAQTRSLEDQLSDRLHDSLTKRFVDRKTATLLGKIKQHNEVSAIVHNDGRVEIEGHEFGHLDGFAYKSKKNKQASESFSDKAVQSAVNRAIKVNLKIRVDEFLNGNLKDMNLNAQNQLLWRGDVIAYLQKGPDILSPIIKLIDAPLLKPVQAELIIAKLQQWMNTQVKTLLHPINQLKKYSEKQAKYLRGVAYSLEQNLGSTVFAISESQLRQGFDYKRLKQLNIHWGAAFIYSISSLSQKNITLRLALCNIYYQTVSYTYFSNERSIINPNFSENIAISLGYYPLKNIWLRVDIIEKLIAQGRKKEHLSLEQAANFSGISKEKIKNILKNIGFVKAKKDTDTYFWRGYLPKAKETKRIDPSSPFAKLQEIKM